VPWAFAPIALVLGASFLACVVRACRVASTAADHAVYRASIAYVALLFVALLALRH
jgi:heme O synthase-like polyprenyltransferase